MCSVIRLQSCDRMAVSPERIRWIPRIGGPQKADTPDLIIRIKEDYSALHERDRWLPALPLSSFAPSTFLAFHLSPICHEGCGINELMFLPGQGSVLSLGILISWCQSGVRVSHWHLVKAKKRAEWKRDEDVYMTHHILDCNTATAVYTWGCGGVNSITVYTKHVVHNVAMWAILATTDINQYQTQK